MATQFLTPVGRIVWGHPLRSTKKKHQQGAQKGQVVIRDGKEVEQWVFGIAFSKADFNQFVMPYMQQEAATLFPHGVPQHFSWKFKDGDSIDRAGKPYNLREGYAGNMVLTISTEAYAPPVYKNEGGRYRQLLENEIKTGDYAVVSLSIKANAPTDTQLTPGLYINPQGLELVGYGQEIVSSGIDPEGTFGGRTYQLPPGATAAPQAPLANVAAPYMAAPVQPQAYAPPAAPQPQQYAAPVAPVQQYAPAPAPMPQQYAAPAQAYPPPAHDFVQQAVAPQQYAPAPQQYAAPVAPGQPYPGMPTGR